MLTARTRPRWQPTPFPQAAAPGDGRTPHPATLPGQHPLVARLLAQRGVASPAEAGRFLKPTLNDLADPAGLPGCAAAADRLARAVRERQPIVVYGDYDVDGVTASAIL
ncbi:MAG: single-stranded-DNA-specific exonuclease RecJ, partial [Planctomycetota bacterium]